MKRKKKTTHSTNGVADKLIDKLDISIQFWTLPIVEEVTKRVLPRLRKDVAAAKSGRSADS